MKSRLELNKDKQKEIEKEKRQEQQKKIIKIVVKGIIFLFIFFFSFFLYVTKIGTLQLVVKEELISSEKLPSSFYGLKVIQFSDLHYENKKLLEKTVSAINIRKPDLVFFTGDLLKEKSISTKDREYLITELKKIETTIGKYAVLGESDNEVSVSILIDCGFTILDDNYDLIYKESSTPILLLGVNTNNKNINYDQAFSYYQQSNHQDNIFSIALFHEPDKIDTLLKYHNIDVAMSGHFHGGEVTIPNVLSLAKKEGAKKYQKPIYQINSTKFYISSGIGTSKFDYRFFARPSITFYRFTTKI